MGNCSRSQSETDTIKNIDESRNSEKKGVIVMTFSGPNVFEFTSGDLQPTFSDPVFFCQSSNSASIASISSVQKSFN